CVGAGNREHVGLGAVGRDHHAGGTAGAREIGDARIGGEIDDGNGVFIAVADDGIVTIGSNGDIEDAVAGIDDGADGAGGEIDDGDISRDDVARDERVAVRGYGEE